MWEGEIRSFFHVHVRVMGGEGRKRVNVMQDKVVKLKIKSISPRWGYHEGVIFSHSNTQASSCISSGVENIVCIFPLLLILYFHFNLLTLAINIISCTSERERKKCHNDKGWNVCVENIYKFVFCCFSINLIALLRQRGTIFRAFSFFMEFLSVIEGKCFLG